MSKSDELSELCQQVHEATGWKDTLGYIQPFGKNVHFPNWFDDTITKDHDIAPLYTSDYLLERLPHTLSDNDGDRYTITVHKVGDSWLANYTLDSVGMHHIYADTPLKALLKLTIKLHQENIL